MVFDQFEIDAMSNALKRAAIYANRLPEIEIAAWYVNTSSGPEFWLGNKPIIGMSPLFYTPAYSGQEPSAWKDRDGMLITRDTYIYNQQITWVPLYTAR